MECAKAVPVSAQYPPSSRPWLNTNLPCRSACPVGTHAGGYVSLIAAGKFEEAYALARKPNPFASICGRICAHPCEAACRRQNLDDAVSIRALKRFVTEKHGVETGDFAKIRSMIDAPRPELEKGGSIAIVGAGPGGMSCAHDLRLMGHEVIVYDAAEVAGGMMRMGIPEYRLPRDLIQKEIDFILSLGVELKLGVEIGKDITLAELRKEHDAVFLAPGCRKGRNLEMPGMDLKGVLTAIDFLVEANLGHAMDIGEELVVVGGGNVAFDVARIAQRFGGTSTPDEGHHNLMMDAVTMAARKLKKKVTMVTLEARDELPADPMELHEAEEENVDLVFRRGPKEVLGENGRVRALKTVKVLAVFDEEGRFSPKFDNDEVVEIPCDTVVFAVGQIADLSFLGEDHGLDITPRNLIAVDRETLATSASDVFAGGDAAFGPRIVIEAVSDGRRAAKAIDTMITGRSDTPPKLRLRVFDTHGYGHPFAAGDYEEVGRGRIPTISVAARDRANEVELVYPPERAQEEATRCLHCWINTIFSSKATQGSECIQCGGCVDVCPVDCIDLLQIRKVSGDDDLRTPDGKPLVSVGPRGAALIKDETACIRCGLCARRCPVGCITMQGFYREDEMDLLALCERVL